MKVKVKEGDNQPAKGFIAERWPIFAYLFLRESLFKKKSEYRHQSHSMLGNSCEDPFVQNGTEPIVRDSCRGTSSDQ